jgi:predicted dehydrogenase
VSLGFRSGACGSLLCSSLGPEKRITLEVFFPAGSERLEGWDFRRPGDAPSDPDEPFRDETAAFLRAAEGNSDGCELCTFSDALETQRTVDAIARALLTDRPQRTMLEPAAAEGAA